MADQQTWRGRPIVDPAHATDLEVAAAVKQFKERVPEEDATAAAYSDYRRDRALDSAAHHLAGVRGAHAAGWSDLAREHAGAYAAAASVAGFDPAGPPPKPVADRLAALQPLHRFKRHAADALWEPAEQSVPESKS